MSLSDIQMKARYAALRMRGRQYDEKDVFLLTGSPRSGTTWLGDVFSHIEGTYVLNEPFNTGLKGLNARGFTPRTYRDPAEDWPDGKAYIDGLLSGKTIGSICLVDTNLREILTSSRLLMKCVRLNRLLPWLLRHYQFREVIVLLRHPCAVVSSQVLHPAFPTYTRVQDFDLALTDLFFPALSNYVRNIDDEYMARAVNWALDQYVPLTINHGATRFMYEDLVTDGEARLNRYFTDRNIPMGPGFRQSLNRASREVKTWSSDHGADTPADRINAWQKRVSDAQADAVFEIMERFGISGYERDGGWHELKLQGRVG